jgi:WS/DGAT/MGAT family acyltransferase
MSNASIPPLDLMFFLTESAQSPKHVGAVQVFELPKNAPANYLQDLVARFKQAPVVAPFSYTPHFPRLGRPQWLESKEIDIDHHVRHSALPAPGSEDQLMEVVQRLHSSLLDRRRPCWMCQVIEGLEGNRFAVYSKIHHAYIDGMSGVKRMYGSLSTSPRDNKLVTTWSFEPKPGKKQQPAAASRSSANPLTQQARGVVEASQFMGKMALQWMKLRDSEAQVPFSARRTRMNKPIEWDTRSTAICTLPLDRIKGLGKAGHCTVNEVVLAIIGAALDDYLSAHGEPPGAPLVALCPMSVRSQSDDSARTQVSAVHVRLGDPGVSPAQRLAQVMASSAASKAEVATLSAEAMMDYGVMIFAVWELLQRSKLDRLLAPSYNVLVSNVPGPGDENLYLCGSRMVASYPISTLLPGVNLNVTLLSHGNSLDFGLLADRHALPDVNQLAQGILEQFANMEEAVLPKPARKPRSAKKRSATARAAKKASAKNAGKARVKSKSRPSARPKVKPKNPVKRQTR